MSTKADVYGTDSSSKENGWSAVVIRGGMVHLSKLPELRRFKISKTAITDEGLPHLRDAPNLRDIRAEESGVSQKGDSGIQKQVVLYTKT